MSTPPKRDDRRSPGAPETDGYWDALDAGHISLTRCVDCRRWQHPPLEHCRFCAGVMNYEPLSGGGRLYSTTVVHYPAASGFELPYIVGLVEVDDQPGVRLAVQVLESDPGRVKIGAKVRLTVGTGPAGAIPVCSIPSEAV